jgi:hypothetical protein
MYQNKNMSEDIEYSPLRKSNLIYSILASTMYISEALDNLTNDQSQRISELVAKCIADINADNLLENILEEYKSEVLDFFKLWQKLEMEGNSSRVAALNHILNDRYGSNLNKNN